MSRAIEIKAIEQRYERRTASIRADRYAPTDPYVLLSEQEKDRAIVSLFERARIANRVGSCSLLEIGCGVGANLLRFLRLGFAADNIVGNELLPARVNSARYNLPSAVRLIAGDATAIQAAEGQFDVVCLFTVMSSILDDAFQSRLAAKAWELTKPGGGILWYDFVYNNPTNADVRGVNISCIRELFPNTSPILQRLTLAPPIGRRTVRWWNGSYSLLNRLPLLRTHVMGWLPKPASHFAD